MIDNRFKTVLLLGALTGLLLWIGSFWGQNGLIFALVFSILMNFGSYWYSDKVVLKMYRAEEVSESSNIYKLVKEVSEKASLPMPKVYVIPSEQPNAFATGRNPEHAAVAFTKGIMKALSKEELEGVAAHELAHVKNRDTLIQSIAATIAGVISYIAMMARWGAIFGGRSEEGGNMLELLALAIVTPLIATIIQLAISRSREYLADATGASFVGSGKGLASALQKMESYSKNIPMRMGRNSTSSLFIVNPFSGQAFTKLFSTHPSTEERVKRLKDM